MTNERWRGEASARRTGPEIRATYRLQLSADFDLRAAAGLVGYLAGLGVSHLYLSPLLTASHGSAHGYDVVDPTTVSAALGGEEALRALADTAHAADLGVIVDIVPNHLGTGADNPLWELLLAEGHSGEGGRVFDVDWEPALPTASGKVVLPVLGDQYGAVLHRGELQLRESGGEVRLHYFDATFPLSPESREALDRSGGVSTLNGTPGEPETWHRLHALLERQHYRLVWWRIGDAVINYRRFFAINDLAAVRVEDEHVFDVTHAKLLELVAAGVIDGLRVDHPDGLRDPARYFRRLAEHSGGVWTVAEKITHPGEPLPDWPVAGTTGYDFANDVLGLFVDPAAEERFTALDVDREPGPCDPLEEVDDGEPDEELDGGLSGYRRLAHEAKEEILDNDLAADFNRSCRLFWALTQEHLEARDAGLRDCGLVLSAVLKSMPVYRTYVDPETGAASEHDERVLDEAFEVARGAHHGAPEPVWDLLRRMLTGRAGTSPAHLDFVARFQQLSSAVMAKGVEDTAFYRYRRLLALNEVGGDPTRFGLDVAGFHAANAERARRGRAGFGIGMLTTATHDMKRGEDVRLRMAALTEIPDRWEGALTGWGDVGDLDRDDAQLVLQTMVGVWPLAKSGTATADLSERLQAYLVKALRESREGTSWTELDTEYEGEVTGFVIDALADPAFIERMADLAGAAGEIAMVSGLAQVLLRCTAPGVPDTYQGNELWDDSLVDPDNRRPVDFGRRRRLLAELDAGDADVGELWAARRDGRVKLWVLSRALG
ncbi:MAG: malto-oligosyltrehalose synthase, partial [Euzebyales bacterium]|nr:malto-oligosyltrehalose synthase [Euzebyales bacterium]